MKHECFIGKHAFYFWKCALSSHQLTKYKIDAFLFLLLLLLFEKIAASHHLTVGIKAIMLKYDVESRAHWLRDTLVCLLAICQHIGMRRVSASIIKLANSERDPVFTHFVHLAHFTHSMYQRSVGDGDDTAIDANDNGFVQSYFIGIPRHIYLTRKCIYELFEQKSAIYTYMYFKRKNDFEKRKICVKNGCVAVDDEVSKSIGVKWCSIHFIFAFVVVVIGHLLPSFHAAFRVSRLKFTERISVSNSLRTG